MQSFNFFEIRQSLKKDKKALTVFQAEAQLVYFAGGLQCLSQQKDGGDGDED